MGALLRTRPGLRRLWRDVGRVQLGEDAAHAVVLDGLGPGEEAVLDDLAAGVEPSDLRRRCRARGAHGASPAAVEHLVSLLRAVDALEPAPAPDARATSRAGAGEAAAAGLLRGGSGWDVLSRRARAAVRVEGWSRTAVAVAGGLVEAGVGAVELSAGDQAAVRPEHVALGGLTAQDVGRPADAATARLAQEWVRHLPRRPAPPQGRLDGGAADGPVRLTVLVTRGAVPPQRAAELVREDAAHLAVVLRVRSADVGPLVVPGRTACLRCVDLHRGERDPEWPRVAAQLAHPVGPAPGASGDDVVLVRLASALAVARALAHLDEELALAAGAARRQPGLPRPGADGPGTVWEVDAGDGLTRGRRWEAHPACGCTWPPG